MKKQFLISFFIAFSSLCWSQKNTASYPAFTYNELNILSVNSGSNVDSTLSLVNSYYNYAIEINDTTKIIETLIALSDINRVIENYSASFDYGGEALFIAEQYKDTFLLSEAYAKYGTLSYLFFQKDEALQYLHQAIQLAKTIANKQQLISNYYTLILAYRQFNEYDMALNYLDTCYSIMRQQDRNKTPYLDSEKGNILLKQQKYEDALVWLNKAAKQFEAIKAATDDTNAKGYLLVIYSYIAEAYQGLDEDQIALHYFEKAYAALEENIRYQSHKADILEKYGWLQYKLQDYKQAFEKLQEAYSLNEKHFSTNSISNSEFITTRNKYQENITLKNTELAEKNLLIAKHQHEILKVKIYLYSGIFLLTIIFITFINKAKIQKQQKKILLIEEKQKEAKALLEQKNKELTTFTLKLIEKEEAIMSLSEHLKSLSSNSETNALLASINHGNSNLWDDFNKRFMAVNEGFYERLNKSIEGLSPSDLKICALIKLNFNGKEMAHLLGISIEGVNKARHRLRKKMKIDRDINLTTYISSL